jgi:hypothetical protein
MNLMKTITIAGLLGTCQMHSVALAAGPDPADFSDAARAYADAMLTDARDVYGASAPLFASQVTRSTHVVPTAPPTLDLPGIDIRESERATGGSNEGQNYQLHRLLHELSLSTGDPAYRRESDKAMSWFFRNTQHSTTGLVTWGEHLSWNFRNDAPFSAHSAGLVHEPVYDRVSPDWANLYAMGERGNAPDASAAIKKYASGLWNYAITNENAGQVDFNRHAPYGSHAAGTEASFPRVGAVFIRAWAETYVRATGAQDATLRSDMSDALGRLTDAYDARRKPASHALAAGTGADYGDAYWMDGDLLYAIEAHTSADLVGGTLGQKLRSSAQKSDVTVLSLPHAPGSAGYLLRARASDLSDIGDPRPGVSGGTWSEMWKLGFDLGASERTTSLVARLMLDRYEQTGDTRYRELALAGALAYLSSQPAPGELVQPRAYADAIELMIAAYILTGDTRYRDRAFAFGSQAMDLFIDGISPLPKASTHPAHADLYDAVTGGDDLMLAFQHLGGLTPVPEPGAVVAGVAAGAALLRRTRR